METNSVTPRRLIRDIVENKYVSIYQRDRVRKRLGSCDWELQRYSSTATSVTPKTLIKNVLKEKEDNNSSIYIPQQKSSSRKSSDKESPPFKRRAAERKRSLGLLKIATPEKIRKDVITKSPRQLDFPSPQIPYMLRRYVAEQVAVTDFEHGVREIRHGRELAAAASKANKQAKPVGSQSASEPETEVWESEGHRSVHDGKDLDAGSAVQSVEACRTKTTEDDKVKPARSVNLSKRVSDAETEVWEKEGCCADPRSAVEFAETRGAVTAEGDELCEPESVQKMLPATTCEDDKAFPEAVDEDERQGTQSSESESVEGHSLSLIDKRREIETFVNKKDMDVEFVNLRIPPSESEMSPGSEKNCLRALEIPEEDAASEEIPPIRVKSTGLTRRTTKKYHIPRLPSSLTKKLFQHFSGMRVSREALDAIEICCDAYFEQLTEDLLAYSNHAGRKTITPEDVALLLRRQNFVTNETSLYALVEEYLPLEYRQEIIPMAAANNVIIPRR